MHGRGEENHELKQPGQIGRGAEGTACLNIFFLPAYRSNAPPLCHDVK